MGKLAHIDEILNFVQKPARYIGGELNSHFADMSADFSIVLCFPDVYEIGASNLGLEILYHLINEKKLARCERVFVPDCDLELVLRENRISLFSLESNSALKSFDILGFTVQCELIATNIVNVLDLSDISIFSKGRKNDEPLVIGGGPALTNPEPFCDFFDLFVLGDGEEAIEDIINACRRFKKLGLSRQAILKKLSEIDGVYAPSLYGVEYNGDNTVRRVYPAFKGVKPVVKKRIVNLENAYFPGKKIVPFIDTVHNRLNIEIARGCPWQCRFCQALRYYSPWRQRPLKKLLDSLKRGIQATGFEEVAFSSLSSSDYNCLDELLLEIDNLYGRHNLSISLPSLRCSKHSLQVARRFNRGKRPALTFAPEAGTDRMRGVIGKHLSEEQILETVLAANAMGWRLIKLYFMIGLPTETDEDIAGIERLVKLAKKRTKCLSFNITISPFVPKAQTAFQWFSMADIGEIKRKINFLNKQLPADVKAHNYRVSLLEALLAKGDRRLSSAIYEAWREGARFDQWADKFNGDIWSKTIAKSRIDLNFYVYRKMRRDEILPWDHLDFGVSKEALYSEYIKGINEAGGSKTKVHQKMQTESAGGIGNSVCGGSHTSDFSRSNVQSLTLENCNGYGISVLAPVMRLRLRFSKKGLVRFISHLEQIEVFQRAARRTELPVAFSAGYNPKIKSSYGPPLSVGQESSSEYVELYFTRKVGFKNVRLEFSKVLPEGFKLLYMKRVPLNFPAIDVLVNVAEYKIKIENIDIAQEKIDEFLFQSSIVVEKTKKTKAVKIDVKPLIKSFKNENGVLKLQLCLGGGFVRPEIILKKLLRECEDRGKVYAVERTNLYVETKNGELREP
jgi:radical SAM family uncharacterized protein/radical SAM-linked protein